MKSNETFAKMKRAAYKEYITSKSVDQIIKTKNSTDIYFYLSYLKKSLSDEDKLRLSDAIANLKDLTCNFLVAKNFTPCYISKHEKIVLDSKDIEYNFGFLFIRNADRQKHLNILKDYDPLKINSVLLKKGYSQNEISPVINEIFHKTTNELLLDSIKKCVKNKHKIRRMYGRKSKKFLYPCIRVFGLSSK